MRATWPICLLFALLPLAAPAQSPQATDFFESRIRPLLAVNCLSCHSPKLKTAGIDLSSPEGFPAIGERLVRAVGYQGKIKMPPTGKLSEQQIADLAEWVKRGAPWPKTPERSGGRPPLWSLRPVEDPAPPLVRNKAWVQSPIDQFILAKLEASGLQPAPPADKLTLLRRATFDLTGLPPAEPEIRDFLADGSPGAFARVVDRLLASPRYGERWGRHWLDVARYADSTGADEDHRYPHAWRYRDYVIDAFNRDLPYDRFVMEQIAGDLLPAERPGERPGQVPGERPGQVNVRGIVATGFLALGPKLIAEQDKPKMLYDTIDEQIDVTSRGLLGLTIACARCHDHKFDPISTKDYYALASIFASTKSYKKLEGTVSQMYLAPLVPAEVYQRYEEHQKKTADKKKEIDEVVEAEAARYAARLRPRLADYMLAAPQVYASGAGLADLAARQKLDAAVLEKWVGYLKPKKDDVLPHLERWRSSTDANAAEIARDYQARFEAATGEWEAEITRWKKKVESALKNQMTPPDKPSPDTVVKDRFFTEVAFGKGPFALPEKEKDRDALFSSESRERLAALQGEWNELKKTAPPEPPMADGVTEGEPVQQHVFIRGNTASPGDEVPKRFPVVLAGESQPPIARGSGRLELARWLVQPDHPLTSRVMVNRVWQWHFGEGLVRTPSNWGTLADPPTHPELLDFLARRFVESGWSMKALHRMILLSSAYQLSSETTAEKAKADPANRLWSRFNRQRLEVEEVRDAMLAADGSLDLTMGGTLQSGQGTDGENSAARLSFSPEKSKRRTVYIPLRRSNLPMLLNLFDFGDATTTGEGRASTNVAPQALFMMNSQFVAERAEGLTKLLLAGAGASSDDARRIERAYLLLLGRKPTQEETTEALGYVGAVAPAGPATERLQSFCHILLSSNEFLYVD